MKTKIEFTSPINVDHGSAGYLTNIHEEAKSEMEFFGVNPDGSVDYNGNGGIEWVVNDGEEVEHIGIWWANREMTDYDGVFDVPPQALVLVALNGISVTEDFSDLVNEEDVPVKLITELLKEFAGGFERNLSRPVKHMTDGEYTFNDIVAVGPSGELFVDMGSKPDDSDRNDNWMEYDPSEFTFQTLLDVIYYAKG